MQVNFFLNITSGAIYRLVPTRWFNGISTVSIEVSYRTASPKSPIAQVPLDLTKMFFDLRSRCAMAGLPEIHC